jgi:hypothetical protein
MSRSKRAWYRFSLYDIEGKLAMRTNIYAVAISEAEELNLELRQRLPTITIGKKKYPQYKVLRKITNQIKLL